MATTAAELTEARSREAGAREAFEIARSDQDLWRRLNLARDARSRAELRHRNALYYFRSPRVLAEIGIQKQWRRTATANFNQKLGAVEIAYGNTTTAVDFRWQATDEFDGLCVIEQDGFVRWCTFPALLKIV